MLLRVQLLSRGSLGHQEAGSVPSAGTPAWPLASSWPARPARRGQQCWAPPACGHLCPVGLCCGLRPEAVTGDGVARGPEHQAGGCTWACPPGWRLWPQGGEDAFLSRLHFLQGTAEVAKLSSGEGQRAGASRSRAGRYEDGQEQPEGPRSHVSGEARPHALIPPAGPPAAPNLSGFTAWSFLTNLSPDGLLWHVEPEAGGVLRPAGLGVPCRGCWCCLPQGLAWGC